MKAAERHLLASFRKLDDADRKTLQKFADFLASQTRPQAKTAPGEPVAIPRPEKESVIKAVKRLTATYPMIDTKEIFHETSSLMNQHILNSKPASEVIDELEELFRRTWENTKKLA
ncbi:MAG: Crp/Fnr family transcriptional regulator [Gammaproteobacteria bacterium]|nr:MAG: Crp/Fnr family transcriptional regulator [Gammaproteobacteria bacterium]RTZ59516.1 MAG: Crp/Fnr family transcriptional regulator [Gammaproteobacteria bacterium]